VPAASVSVAIVGSGGAGSITAGTLLLQAAARHGWFGIMTRSVGPQIRGGEAAALVRLATRPVSCMEDGFHLLLALDWTNADRFLAEMPLVDGAVVVSADGDHAVPASIRASGARRITVPLGTLAAGIPGGRENMVALGIAAAAVGLPAETLAGVLDEMLAEKGAAAVAAGRAGIEAGCAAARAAGLDFALPVPAPAPRTRRLMTGNEATAIGAIHGGVRFVAGYPITPATEVLERLAAELPAAGGVLVQAEDELASINMCIGAAWAGVPALTATSGPGFALMTEGLGLAVAAEVPLVVVDVMRGGPSTGIPTKSEQTDLDIALHGLHGEAPHLVLASSGFDDALYTTRWAVQLAEALQVPAIVLSDQMLGQASGVLDMPPAAAGVCRRAVATQPGYDYLRYTITESGVSPMALPGTCGGQYTADGLEHGPGGVPSSRAEDHARQLDKRARKLCEHDFGDRWLERDGDGDIAVITWGSTAAAVREALERLGPCRAPFRLLVPRLLAPAQPREFHAALAGTRRAIVIEQSHSGQFFRYLRAHYDLPGDVRLLARPGPLPYRPGEIARRLTEWSEP
jgi:2-oxoglutarate ferredoxin oxidoreductase subunit alpha